MLVTILCFHDRFSKCLRERLSFFFCDLAHIPIVLVVLRESPPDQISLIPYWASILVPRYFGVSNHYETVFGAAESDANSLAVREEPEAKDLSRPRG